MISVIHLYLLSFPTPRISAPGGRSLICLFVSFFTIMCLLAITAFDAQKLEEMKAKAHLGVTMALARVLKFFFRVGLTGADQGSSLTDSPMEDSGRADWDRDKRASDCRLCLVPCLREGQDFILVWFVSASLFTGYFMVSKPVNRRHCCHSPSGLAFPPCEALHMSTLQLISLSTPSLCRSSCQAASPLCHTGTVLQP